MVNKDNQVVHPVVQGNTTVSKDKLPNLVVNHVVLGNTIVNKDNKVVNHVVLENTTIWLDNPPNPLPVKIAAPASTTISSGKLPANVAVLGNTPT